MEERNNTMRRNMRHITAVAATTALALTLLGVLALVFGQITPAPTAQAAPNAAAPDSSVLARRAISIPFGIASPLTITQDGGQIMATGHGVCWEDGQMFDLHVRVAQSSTHAFAEGHTIDVCADGARQFDVPVLVRHGSLLARGHRRPRRSSAQSPACRERRRRRIR